MIPESALKGAGFCIFDLDGTLADTEPLHWKAYGVLLERLYGVRLDGDHIRKYIGLTEDVIYRMIESDYGISINDEQFLHDRLEAYLRLVEDCDLKANAWVGEFFSAHPDTVNMLLTSQVPHIANRMLRHLGLDGRFDERLRISAYKSALSKSDVLHNPIPHFRAVCPDLKPEDVPPGSIVVFEDAQRYCRIAKECGWTAIGISHSLNRGTLTCCDAVIEIG